MELGKVQRRASLKGTDTEQVVRLLENGFGMPRRCDRAPAHERDRAE